jgi:hypothetical protein
LAHLQHHGEYTTSKRNNEKWIGQFGTAENEVSTIRDVAQWELIRDREHVTDGESILDTILKR